METAVGGAILVDLVAWDFAQSRQRLAVAGIEAKQCDLARTHVLLPLRSTDVLPGSGKGSGCRQNAGVREHAPILELIPEAPTLPRCQRLHRGDGDFLGVHPTLVILSRVPCGGGTQYNPPTASALPATASVLRPAKDAGLGMTRHKPGNTSKRSSYCGGVCSNGNFVYRTFSASITSAIRPSGLRNGNGFPVYLCEIASINLKSESGRRSTTRPRI